MASSSVKELADSSVKDIDIAGCGDIPEHPMFNYANRLATYTKDMRISPTTLSFLGFYYDSFNTKIICVVCQQVMFYEKDMINADVIHLHEEKTPDCSVLYKRRFDKVINSFINQ